MPIKKSALEKSRKYRIFKVIVFLLPFIVVPILFSWGVLYLEASLPAGSLLVGALPFLEGIDFGILLKILIYAIGYGLYLAAVGYIMRIVFYVIYGGIEDDTKKTKMLPTASIPEQTATVPVAQPVSAPVAQTVAQASAAPETKDRPIAQEIGCLLLLIFGAAIATPIGTFLDNPSSLFSNIQSSGGGSVKTNTCIPTGCGSNWKCSGSYYSNNVRKSISGCYANSTSITSLSSWSGTCRKCP